MTNYDPHRRINLSKADQERFNLQPNGTPTPEGWVLQCLETLAYIRTPLHYGRAQASADLEYYAEANDTPTADFPDGNGKYPDRAIREAVRRRQIPGYVAPDLGSGRTFPPSDPSGHLAPGADS